MLQVIVRQVHQTIYDNDAQLEDYLQQKAEDGWIMRSSFYRPGDPLTLVVSFYKEAFSEPKRDPRLDIPLKSAQAENLPLRVGKSPRTIG